MNESGDPRESQHFDGLASEYERRIGLTSRSAERKVRRLSERFSQWMSNAPDGPILEIGAGTGFLTRHLAPLLPARHYVATDLSRGMVDAAQARAAEDNVEWREGDCLNLEFESATVAGVVGHGILHHVPLQRAVAEVSRVLKPGGRIAFYEPNLVNPVVFIEKKVPFFRPETDTPGETGLLEWSVKRVLVKHGFEVALVTPCEFVLNQVPDGLVPLAEPLSRLMERTPVIRRVGGSLRIMAIKA